jgi:site-specific DNA-methyltransferase (adenine-specific)
MYFNEDCIAGAKKYIEDNSIDLIITDPPYGIGGDTLHKHYNRKENTVIEGYVEVAEVDYPQFSKDWIAEAERVLRPGGSMYIISGYSQLRHILNALAETNLKEINHIIWKYNFGVYTSKKYISSHYHILYYIKPGPKVVFNTNAFYADVEKNDNGGSLNYLDREDVWIINKEYKPGQIKNKNELPKSLLTKMILYSSQPGDLVCDFFLGSFSTAKVAVALGRRACGFEMNSQAYDYQIKEIEKIQMGSALSEIRAVPKNQLVNGGKRLSKEEVDQILEEYQLLITEKMTKKDAIDRLSEKYGRGYWSISKIISKNADTTLLKESNLFD